jgi:hypothetical protein
MLDPQRVNRALWRVSARHWLLSKMMPKQFGARPDFYARPERGGATAAELEEMRLLIAGSREPPEDDEPPDEA